MVEYSFWKPEILPTDTDVKCKLAPIGHPLVVTNLLLSISGMRPVFTRLTGEGYITCQWKGVSLNLREEPELGPGGVFSIIAEGFRRDLDSYLLYVQAHELLGVVLLEDEFVTTREFKKRIA